MPPLKSDDTHPVYIEQQTQLWSTVFTHLNQFLAQPNAQQQMAIAFGPETPNADTVRSLLASPPPLRLVSRHQLGNADGAYAASTDQIYLATETLTQDNDRAIAVLLEELGHYLDAQINLHDSPGDEGDIFARLVLGLPLSASTLMTLKQESDRALITLDQQSLVVEQAQSILYNTRGDSSGDTRVIDLDTNQGKLLLTYESFRIPDQLQITYENQVIFDTGFVGTQGVKTFEFDFSGNAKQLTTNLIANRDPDTRWNFSLSLESCTDTSPLNIEVANGQFEDTDGDGDCDAEGTIYVGRSDGISRMLRIENAKAELDENSLRITGGTVYALIGAGSITRAPLFQGDFEIPFQTATSTSLVETSSPAGEYRIGGLDIDFTSLSLTQQQLVLGAEFSLGEEFGVTDVLFSAADALLVQQNDVDLGFSLQASAPTFRDFELFNVVPVKEFSGFALEYDAPKDTLKVQGKLNIDLISKSEGGDIIADLSGDNFISISDDAVDLKGELTVTTDIKLGRRGWGLRELRIGIDTMSDDVTGAAKLILPFGKAIELDGEVGFKLPIPPLELNSLAVDVSGLNIPIPTYPLVFFQGFRGSVENLAKSDPDPIVYEGGIDVTLGPQFRDARLFGVTADVTLDSDRLSGNGSLDILGGVIGTAQASFELDWNQEFFRTEGQFNFLNGAIQGNGQFRADSDFNVNLFGTASINIPDGVGLFSGVELGAGSFMLEFSNDDNFSNDFVAGWSQFDIEIFGFEISETFGVKGYFDGRIEGFGGTDIPPTNSFMIEPETEWFLMGVEWENATQQDVAIAVTTPDGTVLTEAEFIAANGVAIVDDLSDEQTKVVAVINPTPGVWDIEVVDDTGLGQVNYSAVTSADDPEVVVNSATVAPALVQDNGTGNIVLIDYEAFDPDSDATVSLFYDTDNQGFDGVLLADNLAETDGAGQFAWNTQGIAPGDYFIYARVMDENSPPAFSYAPDPISITEEADLSVVRQLIGDGIQTGETFGYTVTVTNTGDTVSEGVQLVETLPDNIELLSSSLVPDQQVNDQLTYDFGNLAAGESRTLTLEAIAPDNPEFVTGESVVSSLTFDPDANNNVDSFSIAAEAPTAQAPNLQISRTTSTPTATLGIPFSYTVTITNEGAGTATGVVLTEQIPTGLQVTNFSSSRGQRTFSAAEGKLTFELGTLEPGEQVTYSTTVRPIAAGSLVTTTSITSNELDESIFDNSIIDVTSIAAASIQPADLELSQSVERSNTSAGKLVTITTVLSNQGPGSASQIDVASALPRGLSFSSASSSQGSYDPVTGIWTVGNLRDNFEATLEVTAQVDRQRRMVAIAEVLTADQPDPDSTPGNGIRSEDDWVRTAIQRGRPGKRLNGTRRGDRLVGTGRRDRLNGRGGNDRVIGKGDKDRLFGGKGSDIMRGQRGADLLRGQQGNDKLIGGAGADRLAAGTGRDRLFGNTGQDVLRGQQNRDLLVGGAGGDRLAGGDGADILRGQGGCDVLRGQSGNDTLAGGAGGDRLVGQKGQDLLKGQQGADHLKGDDGRDRLVGGEGHDVLVGGQGKDILIGGAGMDVYVFNRLSEGEDEILDFDLQNDWLNLRSIFRASEFTFNGNDSGFEQFIEVVQIGSDASVQIDADGSGSGTETVAIALLRNTTATTISELNVMV